jgi:hypothetical protein
MSPARFSYCSRAWYAVPLLVVAGCQDHGLPTAASGGAAFDAIPANTCEVTSVADSGTGTLRALIAEEGCSTIVFAEALHGETITLTTGQLSITRDVTITGPGAEHLSVSGNNESRVFWIAAEKTVSIAGLTITGGYRDYSHYGDMNGGGILNEGTLMVTRSTIFRNILDEGCGGGIWNGGTLTIHDGTIADNRADHGAGIYNTGVMEISQSSLVQNDAGKQESDGGGIHNRGTLRITHSTISRNHGDGRGGGIFNSGSATLTILHSTVSSNVSYYSSMSGSGGGISNGGTLEIESSTLLHNIAQWGGAIATGGRARIANSSISGNYGDNVGGISHSSGSLEITNSTVYGNGGYETAGGIISSGTLAITHSTITNNALSSDYGEGEAGGIISSGTATLRNTIVANNHVHREGMGTVNCSGTIIDGGYNIEDEASCGFSAENGSYPNTDPLLDPEGLKDNGGPTHTIALLPGSPAIDAIPAGTADCGTEIRRDQRGVSRPQGPGCDIGAFELEQPPCTAVPLDRIGTDPGAPGTIRLGSPFVDAVFFDVEAFLPRSAARPLAVRADDVRWGTTWETGTPAHGVRLADETGDGNRDGVIRFETHRLVAEGNLSLETRRITLWGSDRAGDRMYCATAAVTVVP